MEDKISLLGAIVPCFGSNDPKQEAALESFVTALKPVFELLRSRLGSKNVSESDVQLLGTELLSAEILVPGRSTREEFASWINAISDEALQDLLLDRKRVVSDSKDAMIRYQDRRTKMVEEYKQRQEKLKQQMDTARKERSLLFNPRTEKFEVFVAEDNRNIVQKVFNR